MNVALSQILGQNFQQNPDFLQAFNAYYKTNITAEALMGLTPDEANAHIQSVLADAVESAVQKVAANKHLLTDSDLDQKRSQAATELVKVVDDAVSQARKKLKADQSDSQQLSAIISAATEAISNSAATYNFTPDFVAEVTQKFQQYAQQSANRYYFSTNTNGLFESAAKEAALSAKSYPFNETSTVDVANTVARLKTSIGESASQAVKATETKQFQAPEDVSCSMAVMSWRETRDIFGRRVANTYVAIQVTLRNLNTKNEFLVHDIQVAIDTGVTADYFGRFQAGRDKLLVRAVAQRGQSEDRRNMVVNILQTAGAIGAASSLAVGASELKDAVAVFQGAFIPGFSNIFPDHTVEQLNHINDLVFSASNTSKVLVPIQGSVPLVTFISAKPIEQLPFAWCGYPAQGKAKGRSTSSLNCDFNGGTHNPGYVTPYRGKDQPPIQPQLSNVNKPAASLDNSAGGGSQDLNSENGLRSWDELHFKDWKAAAFRMLQEHTFVVVGGVHIQEVVTQPKVGNLDCPTLTSGPIDIAQTQDGMVTCSATGSGLNLVSAVTLEQGSSKIAGKSKPTTDGNSATFQFKPEDLCDGVGVYSLFLTLKSPSGSSQPTELDSGESVLLSKQSIVSQATLNISSTSATLTLNGKNLDQINDVSLVEDGGTPTVKPSSPPVPSSGGTSMTASFAQAAVSSQKKYNLSYSTKAEPNKQVKSISVTNRSAAVPK